jgi:hypothetical protein
MNEMSKTRHWLEGVTVMALLEIKFETLFKLFLKPQLGGQLQLRHPLTVRSDGMYVPRSPDDFRIPSKCRNPNC